MPLLADREIPQVTIDAAVESARKIAEQFKGSTFDRNALAAALGNKSANSGAFKQNIADLRRYGVLDGRADVLRATELVQRLAVPKDDSELAATILEMSNKIPLFRELYDHYKGSVPTAEDLLASLINMTKADRTVAASMVEPIRSNLSMAWSRAARFGSVPSRTNNRGGSATNSESSGESVGPVILIRAGSIRLQYPASSRGIALMKMQVTSDDFWRLLEAEVGQDQTGGEGTGSSPAPAG